MKVTNEMLDAAVKKATEAGLLPRHARKEDMSINQELIRIVLQAALDVPLDAPSKVPVRPVPRLQVVRSEVAPETVSPRRREGVMAQVSGGGAYFVVM